MAITPVKNDSEHDEVLREIEKLWGSSPGSPNGNKLDALVALVGAYERKAYPVDPLNAIDAIGSNGG